MCNFLMAYLLCCWIIILINLRIMFVFYGDGPFPELNANLDNSYNNTNIPTVVHHAYVRNI